jgi:hypothetical protein
MLATSTPLPCYSPPPTCQRDYYGSSCDCLVERETNYRMPPLLAARGRSMVVSTCEPKVHSKRYVARRRTYAQREPQVLVGCSLDGLSSR